MVVRLCGGGARDDRGQAEHAADVEVVDGGGPALARTYFGWWVSVVAGARINRSVDFRVSSIHR
jgi:hypothetical protein